MQRKITISYQNRTGIKNELAPVPKLVLANKFIKNISNISIGDKVLVQYLEEMIIINKINV